MKYFIGISCQVKDLNTYLSAITIEMGDDIDLLCVI